ncbi:MAG: FeoB-associated Cys-rich membrane protein [Clostridiaceae bacterium]
MLNWLSLNWASLVVGLAVAAIVAAVIVKMIRDKKQHKSTCGCSCSGCPGSAYCHKG